MIMSFDKQRATWKNTSPFCYMLLYRGLTEFRHLGWRNKLQFIFSGGVYVGKITAQTGKCRSVKPMCRGHIGSVGSACLQVEEPTGVASACTRLQTQKNACIFLTI